MDGNPLHQRRVGSSSSAASRDSNINISNNSSILNDDALVDNLLQDNPLRVWVLKNSVLKQKCAPTFIDSTGIKRFVRNWLKVEEPSVTTNEDDDHDNISAAHGGLFSIPIGGTDRQVLLIDDYQKLWNSIALQNESDSFGRHAILFEVAALILYDKKTLDFCFYLMLYNCLVNLTVGVLSHWYKVPYGVMSAVMAITMEVVLFNAYAACARVYKTTYDGNMLTAKVKHHKVQSRQVHSPETAAEISLQLFNSAGYFPVMALLKTLVRLLWQELQTATGFRQGYVATSSTEAQGGRKKRQVSAATGMSDIEMRVGLSDTVRSPSSSALSSSASISASASDMEEGAVGNNVYDTDAHNTDTMNDAVANFVDHDSAVKCGFYMLLNVGAKFLESHTAYTMKVDNTARYILLFSFIFIPCSLSFIFFLRIYGTNCIVGHTGSGWVEAGNKFHTNCVPERVSFFMSFGTTTLNWSYLFYYLGIIVGITGILYGATIVRNLATLWVARYSSLRKVTLAEDDSIGGVSGIGNNIVSGSNDSIGEASEDGGGVGGASVVEINRYTRVSRALLLRRIKTDAYEHYMFIREYVQQASELWSGILCVIIFFSLGFATFCIYVIAAALRSPSSIASVVISTLIFLSLALMPIYNLGVANGAMQLLKEAFTHGATPSNYEVLGGRDEWIEYISQSPAYWTIFGFAVTWSVLYVYCSSAIGSSLAVLLTTIYATVV